jgi:DNA polymerase (family X)
MPLSNKEIAGLLNEIADLLDIKGENQFRVRSYRTAANTIGGLTGNITQMSDDEIKSLPDIGESIAKKIREVADTGSYHNLINSKVKFRNL